MFLGQGEGRDPQETGRPGQLPGERGSITWDACAPASGDALYKLALVCLMGDSGCSPEGEEQWGSGGAQNLQR